VRRCRDDQGKDLNSIPDLKAREKAAQELQRAIFARIAPPALEPSATPFLEALQMAVELKRSEKERTNKTFRETARWFSEFLTEKGWDKLKCCQLTQRHVQAYFDYLIVKKKVRNSTHNTRKNNLRAIFSELVLREYLPENYVKKVPQRSAPEPARRPLHEEEKQLVFAYAFENDPALAYAMLLLGYCAIRPGEIRDLRVRNVDFERGMVTFPGSTSKNNRGSSVTIPADILPVLRGFQRHHYPADFYLFGGGKKTPEQSKKLLPGAQRIGVNTLYNKFMAVVKALKRRGLLTDTKGISLYSLKDTLAIYMLDQGIDVESCMRHFRHADLNIFQRYVKRLGIVNEKVKNMSIDIRLPDTTK
jgi:integrase